MTKGELLHSIVRRNANGVWFLTTDGQHFLPVPRWMWATYEALIQNPQEP